MEKMESDFNRLSAKKKKWYSIVETFIEDSFENKVYQLISVSNFTSEKPEQIFLEGEFSIDNEYRLTIKGPRKEITSEKYYSELVSGKANTIESKIRLTFKTGDSLVSIEWLQSNKFAALQIESDSENIEKESQRILRSLTSVQVSERINLTLEEAFYNEVFRK